MSPWRLETQQMHRKRWVIASLAALSVGGAVVVRRRRRPRQRAIGAQDRYHGGDIARTGDRPSSSRAVSCTGGGVARPVWLRDVVVRAEVESTQEVILTSARGDHDDRDVRLIPDHATDVEAVEPWHHHVE